MDSKQEKALHYYEKHLERLRKYNQAHKEEIASQIKTTYYKMKEDPEKWEAYKAKKREYYKTKKDNSPNSEFNN